MIKLLLQGGLDFVNLFVTAKGFLDPADYELFGEVGVGDQVFGALKSNRAIGSAGVSAVVGIDGVVGSENKAVSGFPLQLCNLPGEGGFGSHE